MSSRKRKTIEEEVRERNENRIKKKLPEINEQKAINYYKGKKNKGERIYRRLRFDGEHVDTETYLKKVQKEKDEGKKIETHRSPKAEININKVVVMQE